MEPGEWARKVLDIIESETGDLAYSRAPTVTPETEVEIAPLVQKVGAISIAEIEKMIGELQAAKDFLESEGERVQREAEQYTTLTQMASASVKIISDTVAGWREAGHPLRDQSRSPQFDLTLTPAEDNTSSARLPDQHQGQVRAAVSQGCSILTSSSSASVEASGNTPMPAPAPSDIPGQQQRAVWAPQLANRR